MKSGSDSKELLDENDRLKEMLQLTEQPGLTKVILAMYTSNIAGIYAQKREYNLALEWYLKALVIREEILGFNIPDPDSYYNYINNYLIHACKEEFEEARDCFMDVAATHEEILGLKDPKTDTCYSFSDIYFTYAHKGEYDNELEKALQALVVIEEVLNINGFDAVPLITSIKEVESNKKDYDINIRCLLKAVAIHEDLLWPGHSDTAPIYYSLACWYLQKGEYDRALEGYLKSYRIYIQGDDKNNPNRCLEKMKRAYTRTGNPQQFDTWLEEALQRLQNSIKEDKMP